MKSVLLVDDEPVLLGSLSRYLTALGYEVRTAGDGRAALFSIDETAPDLLVTDINMPDMDGIEIINALQTRGALFPVVAMSGGGQFDRRLLLTSARVLGAMVTLEKPFELEAFREVVEGALGVGWRPT